MFLESHFGEHAITPLTRPKLPQPSSTTAPPLSASATEPANTTNGSNGNGKASNEDEEDKATAALEAAELDRLHGLGIPVPGLQIKVDKIVAVVWLETLEVECGVKTFADRVRAVVERGVETVAPLWA